MVRKEVVLLWYISLSLKKSKRTIVYLVAHRFQETNRTRLQCLGLTIGLTIGTNMDWIGLDSIPFIPSPNCALCSFLLSHLQQEGLVSLDFLLELKQSEQQGFGRGWASGNVDIYGNNAIATSHHRIRIMVVSTSVCAGTHRDNPSRLRHLIVNLAQSGRHLVGEGTRHDHNVGLTGGSPKHHAEAFHIVSGGCGVHHLDGATRQSKSHGPQGTLSGPVDKVVHATDCVLDVVLHGNLIQKLLFQLIHAVQFTER
mmetsp:Transcript_26476/g.72785  ORF Transcript_26476/g.72785 Transcript_26476/m.72785 type:complete len:255 (-) Transcript_26476:183-947(-)